MNRICKWVLLLVLAVICNACQTTSDYIIKNQSSKKIELENNKIKVVQSSEAEAKNNNTSPVYSFNVGGSVSISFPPPTADFIEVGYDNRELMEIVVPPNNRLLCAFVLNNDLSRLNKGGDQFLTKYAIVQVNRQAEYIDCETNDFKEVIEGAKEAFDGNMTSYFEEAKNYLILV